VRLYRWPGRGGGHANRFTPADALVRLVSEKSGLRRAGTRALGTWLSVFLNRANILARPQKRLGPFGAGSGPPLPLPTDAFGRLDRLFQYRRYMSGRAGHFGGGLRIDETMSTNGYVRLRIGAPS
jgi:hypothetical protein